MAANTILDLNGISEAGIFTTKLHETKDANRKWVFTDNEQDDAKWYTDKELAADDIPTSTGSSAKVETLAGGMKLSKGTGAGLTAIATINASSSQKKWTIEDDGMTGLKSITGSDKDDVFTLVEGGETIKTGDGKDSIDIKGIKKVATVTDYAYGSDVIVVGNLAGIGDSISSAGMIKDGSGDSLQLSNNDGYYKVTFVKTGSDAVNVWKGGTDAKVLDGSNETSPMVMMAGGGADTLLGGSKVDTIHASVSGAYVAGGRGNDEITLEDGTVEKSRQYVAFGAETGTDVVANFNGSINTDAEKLGDTADVLVLQDGAISDIKVTTGTHTVIKSGSGSVSLNGVSTSNANATLLMQEGTGSVSKAVLIGAANMTYGAASDTLVDYYISTNKKTGNVSFAAIEDDVVAELSNLGNFEDKTTFVGVDSVVGGKGSNTLIGAAETKNYLVAGAGSSTLWGGGASSDTLVGAGAADAFFIGLRDGKDTITGFDAKTEDAVDTLYMLSSPATSITRDANAAVLNFADGSSATVRTGGSFGTDDALRFTLDGTNFQTAKIGVSNDTNTFTYDSKVDMYFGGSKDNTLKVASDYDGKSVDIRLNNTLNQSYAAINTVNASEYEGDAFIAGNDGVSELLVGGKGKTTLWGGLGEADTLKGASGSGVTGFYFGKNNGADVITASDSDDKVVFYDFANTDLTSIDIANGKMKFTFNDSSTLEIQSYNSSAVQTFEFTNGTWTYDYDKKEFVQKA